jgi:type II secretory pathway component GspD/PulD (secretin)
LDQSFQTLELADIDEADNENMITAVVLRLTPEITSEESIILNDLSAELIDFDGYLGEVIQPVVTDTSTETTTDNFSYVNPSVATTNQNSQMLLKRKKVVTEARISNGGTIVLGGWTGERSQELTSGIPVLRNMPYFGKLLFSRAQRTSDRTTLLIFLTGYIVK